MFISRRFTFPELWANPVSAAKSDLSVCAWLSIKIMPVALPVALLVGRLVTLLISSLITMPVASPVAQLVGWLVTPALFQYLSR